jgi:hypothetical protein
MKAIQSILFLFFQLCLCFIGQTQSTFFKRNSIGSQWHYGSFLTNDPKADYVRDGYTRFAEIYLQQPVKKLTNSSTISIPQWGAGLFFGETGSRKYIGNMGGAFTFINLPILQYRAFRTSIRLGGGIGWVEKPYNKVSNHKNTMIGTPFNGYINFLWQNEWEITPNTFINGSLSFSHLSNGSTTLPNLGLNIPAISLGFRYGASYPAKPVLLAKDSSGKKWSVQLFTSAGIKQLPWIGSKRYLVNVFNAETKRNISQRSQYGGGIFGFYDRSLVVDPLVIDSKERDVSKTQAGLYVTYQYSVGRLSLPLQIGAPLINNKINATPFQQIGVRYKVATNWTAQVMLKSYGGKADLIHAGIGYKLF